MFTSVKSDERWSRIGLRTLIISIIASVMLAVADGILKGPLDLSYGLSTADDHAKLVMMGTWVVDFRYLADQAVYAATIFFVGAKFFETRSIFTIGFDRLDAIKVSVKGPDENNVVWIGHRYGTRIEADAIAEAFAERLKESAA